MAIEALLRDFDSDEVADTRLLCPEVGVLTMRQTVDLVEFGESMGLKPAAHNAAGDMLWNVKAQSEAAPGVPRSHTADEFVWHTDASFEEPPPRYFMLQVLHGDRYDGGHQNFMRLDLLLRLLDDSDRKTLADTPFPWRVPLEFQKDSQQAELPVLFHDEAGNDCIRYRSECMSDDLELPQRIALSSLGWAIGVAPSIQHVPQAGELLLVDNWRALHARDAIKDSDRHLQRVRFSS